MSYENYLKLGVVKRDEISGVNDELFRSYLKLRKSKIELAREISARQQNGSNNQFNALFLEIQRGLLELYDSQINNIPIIINELERISKDAQSEKPDGENK